MAQRLQPIRQRVVEAPQADLNSCQMRQDLAANPIIAEVFCQRLGLLQLGEGGVMIRRQVMGESHHHQTHRLTPSVRQPPGGLAGLLPEGQNALRVRRPESLRQTEQGVDLLGGVVVLLQ